MEHPADKEDMPTQRTSMFQIGDRVRKRHLVGDNYQGYRPEGAITDINDRWITVKHDPLDEPQSALWTETPRYDYLAEDLEHLNPLLRIVSEL